MSRKCENCGRVFHSPFAPTDSIERKDAATGYVYTFCSQECAHHWVAEHEHAPHPQPTSSAAPNPEQQSRQEEQWMLDGGANIQLLSQTGDSHAP